MSSDIDMEIKELEAQAAALRTAVKLQATAVLTTPSASKRLLSDPPRTATTTAPSLPPDAGAGVGGAVALLRDRRAAQQQHDVQNAYRCCAGVTAFRVRDPDPAAVDGGSVLGVRLEVMRSGKFLRPFYVLLNRPWWRSGGGGGGGSGRDEEDGEGEDEALRLRRRALRVHRHTLPPGVPLAGLAARHLPAPLLPGARRRSDGRGGGGGGGQDLRRFVRRLRRELVRYHHRLHAVGDMRAAAGLDPPSSGAAAVVVDDDDDDDQEYHGAGASEGKKKKQKRPRPLPAEDDVVLSIEAGTKHGDEEEDDDDDLEEGLGGDGEESEVQPSRGIVDIAPADPAATQVSLSWDDGRTGRMVVGPDGEVVRYAVFGADGAGRDRRTERALFGGCERVEDVVARLREGASS